MGSLSASRVTPAARRLFVSVAILLVAFGGISASTPGQMAPDRPTQIPTNGSALHIGGGFGPSLSVGIEVSNFSPARNMSPLFYGVNVRADSRFTSEDATYLAATETLTWRFPGGNLAEEYNYTTDTNNVTGQVEVNNLSNFVTFCEEVRCDATLQLPAEINNSATDAWYVYWIEHFLNYSANGIPKEGFIPAIWEFGNEPALWTNFSRPWSEWKSPGGGQNATPSSYAEIVPSIIASIRSIDPTTSIDPLGGSGGSATDDQTWVTEVMRAARTNASFISIHSYLEGNSAANDAAFYAPLYKTTNRLPVSLPKLHAAILQGCSICQNVGLIISEAGASNGLAKNSEFETSFPMAMWDAVEALQSAQGNVTAIDYFAFQNGYPGSFINASTGKLNPSYYFFKDIPPLLGSDVLNVTLNKTDGGKLQAGGWWGTGDTWSLLVVNLDTVNATVVNLTGSIFPNHGEIESYQWAASTSEPTGNETAWLNSTTVAPDSMELVLAYPLNPIVSPPAPQNVFVTNYTGAQAYISYSQPSGPIVNDSITYGTPTSVAPYCSLADSDRPTSYGYATGGIEVTSLTPTDGYCFAAQAWTAAGASPLSGFVNVSPFEHLPGPPTGLDIGRVTTSTIALNWTNPSGGGLVNDTLYRGPSGCSYNSLTSIQPVRTTYTVNELTAATFYCFAVQAWNSSGGSPLSSTQTTATLPNAPTSVSVSSVTTTTETLAWANPSGTLVNDTIYGGTTCGIWSKFASTSGTATNGTIFGLASATKYCFAVQAWTSGGAGNISFSEANASTLPTVPIAVQVTSITASSETLSWTNPTGSLANDTVEQWNVGSCSGSASAYYSVGVTTSYTVTGLAGASTFSFLIEAWASGGQSAPSSCASQVTLPGPASGLGVSSFNVTSVELSWTNPSGTLANVTIIQWDAGSCSGIGSTYYSVGVAMTYPVSGLSGATVFSFEVFTWSTSGEGAKSSCVSQTTLPGTVTDLSVGGVTTTSATLLWTNPSGTLANDTIYRWVGSSCSGSLFALPVGVVTTRTENDIASATTFSFQVAAWSSSGQGGNSACVPGTTLPLPPSSLSVTGKTVSTLALSWLNPSGTLSNLTLYEWTGSACSGTAIADYSLGVTTTGNGTELSGASEYSFEAQAWSAGGAGARGACVSGWTLPAAPGAPTIGTISSSTIALSWSNPPGSLVNTTVYMWAGASCSGTLQRASSVGVKAAFVESSLANSTTYSFRVQAWSSGGGSAPSSCAMATTGQVPSAPTGLTVGALTTNSVYLSWANPPGTVINDTISQATGRTCSFSVFISTDGAATSRTVTGLTSGVTYCFAVQAWNSSGQSVLSSTVIAFTDTVPGAPTGLEVSGSNATSITWSWTNPGGAD